jgi:transposase
MTITFVGVDVAKATVMVWFGGRAIEVKNTKTEIRRCLKSVPDDAVIGIETTGNYHVLFATEAVAAGFAVYVLNPLDCARYRLALKGRGKTDKIDAEMIARFVEKERDSMRLFKPLPAGIQRLRQLLKRRDKVAKARAMLEQTAQGDAQSKKLMAPAMKKLSELIEAMEALIVQEVKKLEGHELILSIPGIGLLNTACTLSALSVGEFPTADSFVAFAGLDCRPRESGAMVGRRVLSRRGDRMLRKLLYLAAMSACVHPAWKSFYDRHLAKGLAKTQALVALARKLARTIWSMYTHRTPFQGARISCQKMIPNP